MIDKLWGWISGILSKFLTAVINALVAKPLQEILSAYSTVGAMRDFFGQPWAHYLMTYSMALGGSILTMRVLYEAFTIYILRSSGQPADVTGLLIRIAEAAAMVAGGPWFAGQLLQWGNTLAADVSQAPFGIDSLPGTSTNIATAASTSLAAVAENIGSLLLWGGAWIVLLFLLLLVYVQALIRSVEMLVAGVLAPVMAVGQLSPGGGTASVWLREALVLVSSQAIQGTMLYLMAWLILSPYTQGGSLTGPLFAIAAAWVAFRTPTILRQYAYHTGVGSGAASVAQSVVRTVLARLPA